MKLLEYQAKEFFRQRGIPVPRGMVLRSPEEAKKAYDLLEGNLVLKAQVYVGGRGKAGGVKFPKDEAESVSFTRDILETPLKGEKVLAVLAEERLNIQKELYMGFVTDPDEGMPLLMVSTKGGVDIEEVARTTPEAIKKVYVDPRYGVFGFEIRQALLELGLEPEIHEEIIGISRKLYSLYWDMDSELCEINPLVVTNDKKVIAADAKMNIDESGVYRHPELPKKDPDTPEERAKQMGLSYVLLDGDVGILSNGAGLTMATMDLIDLYGGSPANFLDCGERIIRDGVRDGLSLILENKNVKSILINVFGGGVRCDVISEKIVEAINELESKGALSLDVCCCVQGRNMEEGRRILSTLKTPKFHQAYSVEEAVELAVKLGRDRA